jgi:bifunctional DNA-binding transcriptional regulator/antitoxin component of YhaV-PrlF toxin-antitoxin module
MEGSAMRKSTPIRIRKNGALTLPIELRREYNIDDGDTITLLDLEDGAFLLKAKHKENPGDQVAKAEKTHRTS